MNLRIKKEHHHVQVGFNGSGLPLGMREDLHVLAQIAKDGNDAYLLSLFEEIPTDEDLREGAGEKFIEKIEKTKGK